MLTEFVPVFPHLSPMETVAVSGWLARSTTNEGDGAVALDSVGTEPLSLDARLQLYVSPASAALV
jgi:hypothetical protein